MDFTINTALYLLLFGLFILYSTQQITTISSAFLNSYFSNLQSPIPPPANMKLSIFYSLLAILGTTVSAPVPEAEIETRSVLKIYPSQAVNIFTPDHGYITGDVYVFRVCSPS